MIEFDGNQSRVFINAHQTYDAFIDAYQKAEKYKGGMCWKKVRDKEYLFKTRDRFGNGKTLGLRSLETEQIYKKFKKKKAEALDRFRSLRTQVKENARVCKARKINRVPSIITQILRELDQQQLLGEHVMVVDTNALYAYEAAAGGFLEDRHIATMDIDILWDDRKKLTLPIKQNGRYQDVMSILKKVDKSFTIHTKEPFRVSNSKGFMVDLLKAIPDKFDDGVGSRMGGLDDIEAKSIANLNWLLSAPQFEHLVIGADGVPARMVAPDPRVFALHKFWASRQLDRGRTKAARDKAQAVAVAQLTKDYLPHLDFRDGFLNDFPADLIEDFRTLLSSESQTDSQAESHQDDDFSLNF